MSKEINLKEIFRIVKKRLWVVALTTIIAAAAGYFYSMYFAPVPLYQSETRIIVGEDSNNLDTLKVMIKDSAVLEGVSEKLNRKRSPDLLATEISAEDIDDSNVIAISAVDKDPRIAAEIVNTTATVFKAKIASILNFTDVKLLSKAEVNEEPINSNHHNKVILAIVMGIVLGTGLVFLLHSLDETIQSERDLEKLLEVPFLGGISRMSRKNMYRHRKDRGVEEGTIENPNIWRVEDQEKIWPLEKSIEATENHKPKPEGTPQVQRVQHKAQP